MDVVSVLTDNFLTFMQAFLSERPSREAGYNLRVWDKFQKLRLIYFVGCNCEICVTR